MKLLHRDDGARQMGCFLIHRELLHTNPDMVLSFMSGMLIVEARYRHDMDSIKYLAYGEQFDYITKMELTRRWLHA